MNSTECVSSPQEGVSCLWQKLRVTFGPVAAGLLGGSLSGLAALESLEPLCRNVALTYADYPSLDPPLIATGPELPGWLSLLALIVGLAAPVATGALAVWLVKSRDVWADLSAGLTTALACTLAAFVTCIGWPVVLALVVVPSISDLTLLGDSVRVPTPAAPGLKADHPSQKLAAQYPDLERVEPNERGQKLMPKIVSDQVAGGAHSIWAGMLVSLLTAGSLALCGTIAAGYLMRRAGGFSRSIVPYLEITLPLTTAIALVMAVALTPVWTALLGENPFGSELLSVASVVVVSVLMVTGAIRRWPWLPRAGLAITWIILMAQPGHGAWHWLLPLLSFALSGVLIVRLALSRSRQMAAATS